MAKITQINCEICRNFAGSRVLYKFGCSKGHEEGEPEVISTFLRRACKDYSAASRPELIASREHSVFNAGAQLKADAVLVKRTVTTLAKLTDPTGFGKYLTESELAQAQSVVATLRGLAPDLIKAAKLSEERAAAERKRNEAASVVRFKDAFAKIWPGATDAELLAIAPDLREFCDNWRSPTVLDDNGDRARAAVYWHSADNVDSAIAAHKSRPSPTTFDAYIRAIGSVIEDLHRADRSNGPGGLKDFLAWRKTLGR